MPDMSDVIDARIAELRAHQSEIQTRATKEIAKVQAQIDALTGAQLVLTPEVETAYLTLATLRLLPGVKTDG